MATAQKPRRRRRLLIALALLIVGVGAVIYWPKKDTFTVGPETTYVTGPLDADGRVDYVAALNERLRGDITPEQNANVLIWQAIGPDGGGTAPPPEYFRWLGVPAPPAGGAYLAKWPAFAKEWVRHAAGPPAPDFDMPNDDVVFHDQRQGRARRWPWAAADEPDLGAWVAKNEAPLAVLAEAVKREAFFSPAAPALRAGGRPGLLSGGFFTSAGGIRSGAEVLVCRAMMRLKAGDADGAWQDLLTCHRLGRLFGQGGSLIEHLVGFALEAIAMSGELVFVSQAKLSAAQLAACQADLGRLRPPGRVADKVDLAERLGILDGIQQLARDGPDSEIAEMTAAAEMSAVDRWAGQGTDWDAAMRHVNQTYDRMTSALRLPDWPARAAAMEALSHELDTAVGEAGRDRRAAVLPSRTGRAELIARVGVSFTLGSFSKLAMAEARIAQQHRNVTIAVALAAHRLDHGTYPETLAALAPKYLPEVPADLCSGEPLKYQRTAAGYFLYSIGPNRQDDGGRTFDSDPKGDDLVIEMPAKEPPPVKKPEPEPD